MDRFLRDLLVQSLSNKAASPGARAAFARLAAHLLRELNPDLDEATITAVLGAIRANLDQFGIVVTLGRTLWFVSPDESKPRLYVAFRRLAQAAFEEGYTDALAELLQLLGLLGQGQEAPPDEWARAATKPSKPARRVRLIVRWLAAWEHVPPWMRDLIETHPGVLRQLPDQAVRLLHRRAPSIGSWRELARRGADGESVPEVNEGWLAVAREQLEAAVRGATARERILLQRWLGDHVS